MAHLFERMARQRELLTVLIPGNPERHTSCILGVDAGHVLMDELLPATGHALLLAERRLRVSGRLEGIEIRFTATLDRVEDEDGAITYRVALPAHLEYRQRRLDYRAHIPMMRRLRVVLDRGEDADVIEGLVHDLSKGGAGILLPEEVSLPPHAVVYECALELPDDAWLFCTVDICHARSSRYRDLRLVGIRFLRPGPIQSRLLGHCIIELDREFVRKRTAP